jgi:hypothetical protein
MQKRSTRKQLELEKYMAITLAAIDYNSQRQIGSLVCDGHDPMIGIYAWQRTQIRSFFAQRRLDHLQRKFHSYTGPMSSRGDLRFNDYVKEKTGYTIDILESLRDDVKLILDRGVISHEADRRNVSSLLDFLKEEEDEKELSEKLAALLAEYAKTERPAKDFIFPSTYEEDALMVEHVTIFSGGGSMQDYSEDQSASPDGRKRIFLSRSGRKLRANTSIHINFPHGSGCIFQANVNSAEITARWINDHTIVIKTKGEFEMPIKVKLVESHGAGVDIIYEELSA